MAIMTNALLDPYRIEIRRDEEGYFHASYPTLGESLFHAVGLSAEEALESLTEAAPSILEWAFENDYPLKPPQEFDRPKNPRKTEARRTELRASVYYGWV